MQRLSRARQARLGSRARARRSARLSQRAGERRRTDRHHRPGDGLRHHRHRAGLCAGEIQEARRRRLLQDHQPRRAGGAARARLWRKRHRRDRRLRRRPRLARPGAGDQPHHARKPRALRRRRSRRWKRRCRPPSTSNSSSTSGRWAPTSCAMPSASSAEDLAAPSFDLLSHLGFTKREIDAANIHVCGAMTIEGAPHLKPEHYAVFDCANPCGRTGKRYLSVREPHPHDGGGAAVHFRRHLQDHQHAERGDGRGLQGGLHAVVEARPQGERALPRRLETVAAAAKPAHRRRGRRRRRDRGFPRQARRLRVLRRSPRRWSRKSSSALW